LRNGKEWNFEGDKTMLSRVYNDYAPLARLHDEMNHLLEHMFEDAPALRALGQNFPGVNLWEEGDAAVLEAELPGLSMNDLEMFVVGRKITLRGERKITHPENAAYHRRERTPGKFERTLTLPWEIDGGAVEARLCDGVLTVKLPKAESAKPRKIPVLGV
jgi:HSP20 family protein